MIWRIWSAQRHQPFRSSSVGAFDFLKFANFPHQRIAWRFLFSLILLLSTFAPTWVGYARQDVPPGPVYIVQQGDTLWDIAARFGVSVDELQRVNGISDPGQLKIGDRLVIPGLEGVEGVIVTQEVPFGETLRSLSRKYMLPEEILARLNRLTSPTELFAGATLIIPERSSGLPATRRRSLSPGQSLLELAVSEGVNPWALVDANTLPGNWAALPGDILRTPGEGDPGPGALPPDVQAISVEPLALIQGKAAEIVVSAEQDLSMSGSLIGRSLNFFPSKEGRYVALQGVHAMTEAGIYPLTLSGKLPDGTQFNYSQMVPIKEVGYPYDQPLTVNPTTIDPSVTKPEDAQWTTLASPVTPEQFWSGVFKLPSPLPTDYCLETNDCWSSRFGNRRSYNGSEYSYFHTGLDIVGRTGTEIFAPADGVVVFAGPLTVRGNATMINHGRGIYTGYMHQSEILVKPGEKVKAGQLIGRVGGTGRVQGPHLHWELWAGGVQVDPLDWLLQAYP